MSCMILPSLMDNDFNVVDWITRLQLNVSLPVVFLLVTTFLTVWIWVSACQTVLSMCATEISDVERLTYSVLPQDCGVGEVSWAGLCFNPSQWSMVSSFAYKLFYFFILFWNVFFLSLELRLLLPKFTYPFILISLSSQAAVARSFSKSIDVYDQDIHLRTLRT